ncbi:cytidine/deoxycytidylate deaminase, zinc-binding region [Synechocystis sp. LKSZ1]
MRPQLTAAAYDQHYDWMGQALALARTAGEEGEIPVGAVIVDQQGHCLARAANRKERDQDPTAHAELLALRLASQHRQHWRLEDCILYVTLEPCPMCTGAILQARLGLLVYGAADPKTGTIHTVLNLPDSPASNHCLPSITGIRERECRQLLQDWFAQRRR